MDKKTYVSVDQLCKFETCFYMKGNGKCSSYCDAGESYRPAYDKLKFDIVASVCGFPCGAYTFEYCPNCGAKMDGGNRNADA